MKMRLPLSLPLVCAIGLILFASAPSDAQTNLALTATATDSGGGQVLYGYGPQNMNDGNILTYQWISTSGNPDPNAFAQLWWSSPQSIGSITLILRVYSSGRLLDSASIQYWNAGTNSWVTDVTYPSQQGAITYTVNLTQTRTTQGLRITNMVTVGSQPSNPWIAEWQVWAPSGPSAPASITVPATSTTGNYTVTWSAVTGVNGYDLEEDTASGFTNPTTVYTGTSTSFGVTGKGPGTYYYRVRAFDSVGNSPWTAGSNGCVVQVPPAAPASITVPVSSDTGSYTVSWVSSQGATGYDLEEDTAAGFTNPAQVYSGTNTSFNVTGKVSGTYYYRVRATNTYGTSAWTAGANGCSIVPPQPPATVTVPASSVTGNYQVSWSASAGAASYDLEEDVSAGFTAPSTVFSGSATFFDVTGKVSGTYYYRVRASNGAGASAWAAGANGCQIVAPAAPIPLQVPTGSSTGNYTVSWGASLGATLGYELQEDTGSGFTNPVTLVTGPSLSFAVFARPNGTYYYRVRAANGAGQSAWTTDTVGCTVALAPPAAPATITVPPTSSTGGFVVQWSASAGATGYQLEESPDSTFASTVQAYAGPNTAYAISGKPNGTYWYRVRATNAAGASPWLNSANGCRVTLAGPGRPGFLTVPPSSATGTYDLSWGPVSGATLYELEEATAPDFAGAALVFAGPATGVRITGRLDGTYWYRVRAQNPVGTGSWRDGANPCVVTLAQAALAVDAGPANPAASLERPGSAGVPMLQIRLAAGGFESIRLQTLVIRSSGSGDEAAGVSIVTLVRDTDGDGTAATSEPVAAVGSFSADDGSASFDLSSEPVVPAGGLALYLVCYDFATTALPGGTFQAGLVPGTDLTCLGGSSSAAVTPDGAALSGGVKTLAVSGVGSLSVSLAPNSPAAGTAHAPSSGHPLLQISLAAGSMEDVRITRLKFQTVGTGNEASGVTATLYEDADGDGRPSPGDVALGTLAPATDNEALEFTGLSLILPAGAAMRVLLAYDFADGAAPGGYGALLESAADVDAVGDTTAAGIQPSGTPVAGFPQTLVPSSGAGDGAVYFMGGCAGGAAPPSWAGYLLLLVACVSIAARRRSARPSPQEGPSPGGRDR